MSEKSYLFNPIVIVGCQRSGTTLLRTILGQHSQLLEHPKEPQFILELYQRFGYEVRDVATAVAYLLKHPYLPDTITSEALHQAYAAYTQLSLSTFFQIYLQVWAGDQLQSKRPILKDPALVYHLDLITKLFPKATIIHVIRDPRGSVASQKTRWQHYTTWECATLWKKALQNVSDWNRTGNLPIPEICYEQIILDPQKEISSLCIQLKIPYFPEMLNFEEQTISFSPGAPPQKITFKTVDKSRLNQWQKHLPPMDIQITEYICLKEMKHWGYKPVCSSTSNVQFYSKLIHERLNYFYKSNGQKLKRFLRKTGWHLGIGLLQVPPKELIQTKSNTMSDQRKYWQTAASPVKIKYIDKYATGKTALDIGCGAGHYARILKQKGYQVVGLDLEPQSGLDFPCIQAHLHALPISGTFDTVLAFDVLEHEANEEEALSELRRITRNRLILSVPNTDDQLLTPYNLTYKHHIDKTHYREYSLQDVCHKLENNGFQVIEIKKEGPVSPAILAEFVPRWLQSLIRILIKGLHRLHMLKNSRIMADIYVVAERKP